MPSHETLYNELILIEDAISSFFISGDYKTAETVLFSIRDKAKQENKNIKYWISNLYIGNCYQKSGEVIKAKKQLVYVLTRCKILDIQKLSLQFLGRVYSQTGESGKAIKCLEQIAIWRNKGVLFSQQELIARLELPGLWRIGLHRIRTGNVKEGEYALDRHKDFLSSINYQKANSLSCFAIASIIKGSKNYDSILSAIFRSRDLYQNKTPSDLTSGFLWKLKASVSTLLVEATVDNILFNRLSAYLKLLIVRIFLRKWHLPPNTEGIGEIISMLEVKFPEMKKVLYLSETNFRGWVKSLEYSDTIIEADRLAIEKVKEWENAGKTLSYSTINKYFDGIKESGYPLRLS